MAFEITGIGSVDAIAAKFDRFASGAWRQKLMANVGEEVVELVREGFERQADPHGSPWAPLKRRAGRILQDTGRLRNSFHRKSLSASQVTVGPSASYARFHQSGTKHMPARKMVPDGSNLPSSWEKRIAAIAREAMLEALK
ncbi:MAG: hypothetical protein AMXMBFR56_76800 [Polyangiaceae bacterium]